MKASTFTFRLSAALAAVLLVAAALTVLLNYSKLRRTMMAQQASNFLLVTHQTSEAIEAGMNLGLSLSMLENTQGLLERQQARDPLIQELLVYSSNGRVLYSTDATRIGTALPQGWAAEASTGAAWRAGGGQNAARAATRLMTAFGQVAGGVVLRYDTSVMEARLDAIFFEMLQTAVPVTAVCVLLAYVAALLITRPLYVWLAQAGGWAESLASGQAPPPGTPPAFADLDRAEQEMRQLETERPQAL